jgi:hypothetical protein
MKVIRFPVGKYHDSFYVSIREFTIKPLFQGLAFFPGQVIVHYFLRCALGRPANAKLDKGGVVMKVIYLVINTVVFAVGHLCSKEAGLKSCILNRVVVCLLVYPSHIVVAQIVYLDAFFCELLGL